MSDSVIINCLFLSYWWIYDWSFAILLLRSGCFTRWHKTRRKGRETHQRTSVCFTFSTTNLFFCYLLSEMQEEQKMCWLARSTFSSLSSSSPLFRKRNVIVMKLCWQDFSLFEFFAFGCFNSGTRVSEVKAFKSVNRVSLIQSTIIIIRNSLPINTVPPAYWFHSS